MNLDSLKEAARARGLDQATRKGLLGALRAKEGSIYETMDVVGWAAAHTGPSQDEKELVESFLDYKQDSMVPSLALTILAIRWGLADEYRNWIRRYLAGLPWDVEDAGKLAAAASAGRVLERRVDMDLVRDLLAILSDPEELSGTREAAYSALALAKGVPLRDQIQSGMKAPAAIDESDPVVQWAMKLVNSPVA